MGVIRNDLHITRFLGALNHSMAGILERKNVYSFFSDWYEIPVHVHSESIIFQELLK